MRTLQGPPGVTQPGDTQPEQRGGRGLPPAVQTWGSQSWGGGCPQHSLKSHTHPAQGFFLFSFSACSQWGGEASDLRYWQSFSMSLPKPVPGPTLPSAPLCLHEDPGPTLTLMISLAWGAGLGVFHWHQGSCRTWSAAHGDL